MLQEYVLILQILVWILKILGDRVIMEHLGLQALIKEKAPLAIYTHCSGHCLNLVISHSCSLPTIRNVLDKMKATCLNSPKRNELLTEIVSKNVAEMSRRKPLIDLCKTRWAERHSAFLSSIQIYSHGP